MKDLTTLSSGFEAKAFMVCMNSWLLIWLKNGISQAFEATSKSSRVRYKVFGFLEKRRFLMAAMATLGLLVFW